MSMKTKVEGVWKEIDSFYCKRQGQWKQVKKIYEKDGASWKVVFLSPTLIDFYDYPYPIPVMAGWKYRVDGGSWVDITANGQINSSGTFSGRIRVFSTLTLSNWFTEEGFEYGDTVRKNGTALSTAGYNTTSFVNNSKGYVCGGYASNHLSTVDVYDSSGNRTTGTQLSTVRQSLTSFVNNSKGYVCGGVYTGTLSTVDVYDSSGNRTTGNSLSTARHSPTSFVNNSKGYVCGGTENSINSTRSAKVDVYDSSGNRTTGTRLSVGRDSLTSFVNNSKGYVCGGYASGQLSSTVDVYDSSGNRTTGTALSVGRYRLTSFVKRNKGYVCGGVTSAVVDVYDSSGNRTTGTSLSVARGQMTSFVNGNRGYVCGGYINSTPYYSSKVDVYYDEEITTYKARVPMPNGSYYELNNISGYATESEVMVFDEKVTGTIEYQSGVIPRRGLIYDKAIPSDTDGCLTYTGLAMGMTPMSGASGSANGGSWESDSLFSSIQVGYLNGSTWTQDNKAAMTGSTTYNCFTRIPKIYQRVTKMDDYRVELVLDTKPFKGATLHPAFVMDGVEVNYKYIGRFLGRNVSSKLTSTSGGQPTHSLTRAEFRTLAKANGSNYGLMSYYDWDLVNKLFLFAFKNFDSQTALGKGWTGKTTYRNTGSSNGYAWNCGWQDATTVMSFIGIEDWWGNTFTFIDNFLTDASYIYASQLSNPVDDVAGMTAICPNPTALSGIPLTVRGGLNDFFIAEKVGGSETTGICDQQYYDAEQNGGRVGAYYGSANVGGAFYLNAQNSISSAGTSVGARLVHWE